MNFRLTATLFVALLVLGFVLLVLALTEGETSPSGDLVLSGLAGAKGEQIDTLELERADGSRVVFTRTGKDQWRIAEPINARADSPAISRVIDAILRARATAYAELSPNPAVHGLDQPSLRVVLREGDKSDTLNIGDVTIGGTKAVGFVTTSLRKRPMAVLRSDLDALFKDAARTQGKAGDLAKWVADYRAKSVFTVDSRTGADDLTKIKITSKGKELALEKKGGWTFVAPASWGDVAADGDTTTGSFTGARPLLNSIVNLQAQTAEDFLVDPKDLKEYGLDAGNPDLIRIELTPKEGPPEVAYIGKKADATPPAPSFPGAPPPVAKVYVRVEGTPGVIRATPGANFDALAAVVANPDSLRDRDLIRKDSGDRIDAVDVTIGSQLVKLRKSQKPSARPGEPPADEWKLYGGPNDPQTANSMVTNLLGLLTQSRIIKEFPATNDANFTPAETKAEIKLWVDGIEPNTDAKADPKAEPKLKGTPIVLQFGKKDPTGVYVRRTLATGAKADFLLPEKVKVGRDFAETDVVAAVARIRLDYLNVELKKLESAQANRLTIALGAKVTEVTKSIDSSPGFEKGKWTFALPADRKGVLADAGLVGGDLLNSLASERPIRLIAEQPSDAELAKFGLDPKAPRMKVTVGLDVSTPPPPEADKERIYYFGNETDDKQSVYARQEGKAMVFTVSKSLFDKLSSADLQDKTVVRFDLQKVKKVKIRGWREKIGQMLIREFERQGGTGGTWVATNPKDLSLDPAAVDRFLGAILGLKVKEYLPPGRRPEQHFPPEEAGFEITIELEGAPIVLLNIAVAVDNGASRIAALGSPPSETLFTLPADALLLYRDNVGAFVK